MPRIPSAADVNPIGGSAGRLPSVRADAGDFGFPIARGLSAFGQGLGDVGDRLAAEARRKAAAEKSAEENLKGDQLDQARAHVETGKARVTARKQGQSAVDSIKASEGSPDQMAQQAVREFEQGERDLLAAVAPQRRAAVQSEIAPVRHSVEVRAHQRAHNLTVENLMQDTEEILQSLTTLALREPEAAQSYVAEGEALLQSLARTGALTQEQLVTRSQAFRRSFYTNLLRSQAAIDAVADLNAGVYDEALNDAALKDLLLKESTRRLKLERAQSVAGTNWLVVQARRGAAKPVAAAGQARLERVGRVRSELEALRYAPEAKLWQGVTELPLAWEAEDAREVLEIQEEFRVQAEEMLRRRREDPAAYVMGLPRIAEAFAAAEADPTLLPEAIAGRLAAQAAMGLSPEEQTALTLAERRQIIAGLQQLAPEQRTAALRELHQTYGEQAAAVVADLAEAGFPVAEVLAADPSGGPEVESKFAQVGEGHGGARPPEAGVIDEAAEKPLVERPKVAGSQGERQETSEDMELGLPSSRSKRNPLRKDESVEGRLHIPKLEGTPREQAKVLMARFGLTHEPPRDVIAEKVLDVLEAVPRYREILHQDGKAGMERFRSQLQEMQSEGVKHGLHPRFSGDVAALAGDTTINAYKYPWSLSNLELTTAIGAMAESLSEAANRSVSLEFMSALVELFIPAGKVKRGVGLILNAVGLSDTINSAVAEKHIGRLIGEAIRRNLLIVDPSVAKDIGL